jgi:hypothetical protein
MIFRRMEMAACHGRFRRQLQTALKRRRPFYLTGDIFGLSLGQDPSQIAFDESDSAFLSPLGRTRSSVQSTG